MKIGKEKILCLIIVLLPACATTSFTKHTKSIEHLQNGERKESTTSVVSVDNEIMKCDEMKKLIDDERTDSSEVPSHFPIPEKQRVILSKEALKGIPFPFVPSEEEIEKVNCATIKYLETAEKTEELRYILGRFKYYYVQYGGYIEDGTRYIGCNYFFELPPNDCEGKYKLWHPDWKTTPIVVMGGGVHYWSTYYNLKTDVIEGLWVNAPK